MAFLSEAAVEQALLDQLHTLGYSIEREDDIGPTATGRSARATTRPSGRSVCCETR